MQSKANHSSTRLAILAGRSRHCRRTESERALIESVPSCLAWLDQSEDFERQQVRAVLEKINRGQILDLEWFRDPKQMVALETAADLDEYTYLVAGSAGEFWTRICFPLLRKFSARARTRCSNSASITAMGLQLINILRDAGADLRAGRCYFPNDELAAVATGAVPNSTRTRRFLPIYRQWRENAEQGIKAGIEYARAVEIGAFVSQRRCRH